MAADILKIEKTIRKSMKDYAITAKYDEEVLVRFISVDLYLALEEKETAPPKRKSTIPNPEVINLAKAERN